jgi:hypothetical protein
MLHIHNKIILMASSFVKSKFSSTINLTNLILLPLMTTLIKPISILFKFYKDIWDFMAYLIMMVAITIFVWLIE